ncbi:hypothetical protein G7Y79_00036g071500 [Physcia stellaris]|nr:hypothetical protein G7Y79_00036g071500 [Physcia stellaris]
MAAAGFSGGGNDSDANVMQCTTCSLLIYSGYFTPEPLKKHLQNAPHCPLAIQLQQEAESKHVVEKPKTEPPPAPAPPAKPLSTYEDRLSSLDTWLCSGSKDAMAAAGFSGTHVWTMARCMECSAKLFGPIEEPLKEHLQKSPQCPLALQLEKETPEAIAEAAKPTPVAADIGYFDPTLLCDIQEFNLFREAAGFLQQLRQGQHQYRESDLLALLPECLRGPALAWYRQQQSESETAKGLSEWLEALATAFPAKPPAKSSNQTSSSAPPAAPPPQYHSCLTCSASFSSLARLLQHTQEAVCKKAVCKHCEGAFDSKNKLHEHIRQHHATKEAGYTPERPRNAPLTPPPTPPEASTTMLRKPVTTPKRSRLPLPTPKIIPMPVETASKPAETALVNGPLTPPATPTPMLRKSASKPYLTIHDLVRMFRGKPSPFGLPQHQKRRPSPQSTGARPPTTYQSRITAYFLPAANQKAPISQGLKSPNPKSFQQHMPAEPLPPCRPTLLAYLPEKSAFSPYKKPGFSYTSLQSRSSTRSSFLQSRSSFAWPRPTSPPTSPPSFRSPPPDHVCCTCFGHSSFRNGLFDYRRPSQRYPLNRRPIGGIWER